MLKSEIEKSTGCTDPGGVALAASRASRELGCKPKKIIVTVSPNIYKNGVSVGIPGTDTRGLHMAAALGSLIDKSEMGLAIFTYATPQLIADAKLMIINGMVEVNYREMEDPLYIKVEVFANVNDAYVLVVNDYSNITEVSKNGTVIFHGNSKKTEETQNILKNHSVKHLYDLILGMDWTELEFLIDAALINREAAEEGLMKSKLQFGRLLNQRIDLVHGQYKVAMRAQTLTAAAGEARMLGLNVPIMAIVGSGNHGITNFLGTLAVGEELGVPKETLAKALAISSMVTIYIKGYVKRMTAFCGCAVAAATGVSAGVVYMLGGTFEQSVYAMQSVIGTLGGMFCDGAKESCAFKLSTATTMAVQFAYLAMEDCHIPSAMGIIGPTIEDTFHNLGQLNNPGMVETDRVLISIIEKNFKD